MKKGKYITVYFRIIIFLIITSSVKGQNGGVNIIPMPETVIYFDGNFRIRNNTGIFYNDNSLKEIANVLKEHFDINKNNVKYKSSSTSTEQDNGIFLRIDTGYCSEGYKLKVTPQQIICEASTPTGIFYAMQSLIQMAAQNKSVASVTIEDSPQFEWRGFMLDVSRHFFGKEVIKQYLDIMARLKMNRFHWHLTDEQAWRIEIKSYPKLTTMGATGSWSDSEAEAQFYTQEDIKDIIEYARRRHIMVIPEIDMPGHAIAATRAYPEISGGGEGRWEGFTFHPAKEETYEFIDKVLTEVAELFPAPYIHIGADEVHFGNQSWFTDPVIQKFIKDNYLSSELGIEHYFVRRVCEIVNNKGKKMIGWDEIINTGVTPEKATVMWWRHDKLEELTNALNKGFNVIMTPRIPCYFDFIQDDSHKIGRRWDGNFNELHTVYSFPGSIESRIIKHRSRILGLQANLWTERVKDKSRLEFMIFPRLLAIAEDGWTRAERKNYKDFENRVKSFMSYFDSLGINYFNPFEKSSSPEPWGPEKQDVVVEG